MPPLQKPLMAPQHMPPSLQQLQNQQLSSSHPQGQTLLPSMQQLGQLQVPQSTGLPSSQTLPSQQLPGLGGELSASQPLMQPNTSGTSLQTPLGFSQQGMAAIANQPQLPSSNVSQQLLQRPIQQMPSQLPQVLLQQQAQTLQSSFQQSQQAIFQLQQQLQLMQQSGINRQQISQNAKQQVLKEKYLFANYLLLQTDQLTSFSCLRGLYPTWMYACLNAMLHGHGYTNMDTTR